MAFQQASGKQIRQQSIETSHIKGKLAESVLDIDWGNADHARDILRNKVITDFVQLVDPVAVSDAATSTTVTGIAYDVEDMAGSKKEGVVLQTPIRFRLVNGDPLVDSNNKEVVAKLTAQVGGSVGNFNYTLAFFDNDGTTPFNMPACSIEILYPVKTTLWDALDAFASNERFVDGAADVGSRLDLKQIAGDLFGDAYIYNRDGQATRAKSLLDELLELTHGTQVGTTDGMTAAQMIDEVFGARGGEADLATRLTKMAQAQTKAVDDLKNDIASNEKDKGASLVGIEDPNGKIDATNVEGALIENADKIAGVEQEVETARGTKASVGERLDISLNDDGTLKDERLHKHNHVAFKLEAESGEVVFANVTKCAILVSDPLNYTKDDLEVYVNGDLQAEGLSDGFNYDVLKDVGDNITGVTFNPEKVTPVDIVILKWTRYN